MEKGLIAWIQGEGGYVHPAIDLFAEKAERRDRGVVARQEIEKDEQLLLIPEKCALYFPDRLSPFHTVVSIRTCAVVKEMTRGKMRVGCEGEVMKVLDEEGSTLTPFLLTLLLFLRETAQGSPSHFGGYIQTLPTEPPPSLITWSINARKLLRGSCTEKLLMA